VSGTLLTSAIAMLVAFPAGLLTAIYLSEYSAPGVRRVIRPILEILAGVPTVVYGYFALQFATPLLQQAVPGLAGFNALSPGIVMGIMILPLVSSLSEDALHSVPNGLREARMLLVRRACRRRYWSSCLRHSPVFPLRRSWPCRAQSARP